MSREDGGPLQHEEMQSPCQQQQLSVLNRANPTRSALQFWIQAYERTDAETQCGLSSEWLFTVRGL